MLDQMRTYLLPDYKLSCLELLQSFIVPEYGLRHLEQANLQSEHKMGHRLIALIEFVPVLGQIAMLIEWIAFKVFAKEELLFYGSQEGANGFALADRVLRIVGLLDRWKENGVEFNRDKVTGHIEGGTCSAMALDFAEWYFNLRKRHIKTGYCSTDTFLNCIRNLGERFAASSEEMRIRQAAFNTIEVRRDVTGIDTARNKIQSLANLHAFKVDHSSHEIQVDQAGHERVVKEEISKLSNGLYLLRTILPSDNEKLEVLGHSMIYVKDQQEGFFYDPNKGASYFVHMDYSTKLSESLESYLRDFRASRARFYRLVSSEPQPT